MDQETESQCRKEIMLAIASSNHRLESLERLTNDHEKRLRAVEAMDSKLDEILMFVKDAKSVMALLSRHNPLL